MNPNKVPQHVAMIMDGNGRWAKKRWMPRNVGHREGAKNIRKIAAIASRKGIKVLTLYAFSTENWNRPEAEVNYLMELPFEFFEKFVPEAIDNNIQIQAIGALEQLPDKTQSAIEEACQRTAHCDGMILNFAINYGARYDIVHAVNQYIEEGATQPLTEERLSRNLATAKLGELQCPDLIIRTSGELRLSNFLLWEAAYSEFYFTDVYWPDFKEKEFELALASYAERHRRYGKL